MNKMEQNLLSYPHSWDMSRFSNNHPNKITHTHTHRQAGGHPTENLKCFTIFHIKSASAKERIYVGQKKIAINIIIFYFVFVITTLTN